MQLVYCVSKLQDSLRELEVDLLAGELLVHRGEGLCLVLDVGLLGLVQVDLEQTGAVQTDPNSLANNLGRVDEVIEDGDRLLSPGAVHLLCSSDVELPQLSLQVRVDL